MKFNGISNIDGLIKKAELEILLKEISVSSEEGTTIFPVKCPGKGRVDDYGKTEDGEAACAYRNNYCRYFRSADFRLDDYLKKIICNVQKGV